MVGVVLGASASAAELAANRVVIKNVLEKLQELANEAEKTGNIALAFEIHKYLLNRILVR